MGMGFKFQMGIGWDGDEVFKTGGIWYKKFVIAHLYCVRFHHSCIRPAGWSACCYLMPLLFALWVKYTYY